MKSLQNLIIVTTMLFFTILFSISCNKSKPTSKQMNSINPNTSMSSNAPTLENGILKFSALNSFTQYVNSIKQNIQDNTEIDAEEYLENLEVELGHYSYRTKYNLSSEQASEPIIAIENDLVLQTLLNDKLEIIIGENYVNASTNFYISIKNPSANLINVVRQYVLDNKDPELLEDNLIKDNVILNLGVIDVVNKSNASRMWWNGDNFIQKVMGKGDFGDDIGNNFLRINDIIKGAGCNSNSVCLHKFGIYETSIDPTANWDFEHLVGYNIEVNWGDGTPILTNNVVVPGFRVTDNHVYANSGTYTIQITVRVKNTANTWIFTLPPVTVGIVCNPGVTVTPQLSQTHYPLTGYRVKCELWNTNNGVFGSRIKSQTTLYKQKSNGSWAKQNSALIESTVSCSDIFSTSCLNQGLFTDTDNKVNAKSAQAEAPIGFTYGFMKITSLHKVRINGIDYSFPHELSACP